jgi:hypothetical protein
MVILTLGAVQQIYTWDGTQDCTHVGLFNVQYGRIPLTRPPKGSKKLLKLVGFELTESVLDFVYCVNLQDTLLGVLRKIATARSISVRFSSNFYQMFSSPWKIW